MFFVKCWKSFTLSESPEKKESICHNMTAEHMPVELLTPHRVQKEKKKSLEQ